MNQSLVKADRVRVREHLSVPIRHSHDQMSAHGLVGRTDAQHVKTGSRDGSFGEEMRTEGDLMRGGRKEEEEVGRQCENMGRKCSKLSESNNEMLR